MLNVYILRKNKIFNKSRYSRNRQTTRVAFYLAIVINILVIFVVFILYYKVLFKLGLLWVPFYIFLSSFFLPSFLRVSAYTSLQTLKFFFKNLYKNNRIQFKLVYKDFDHFF